MYGIRLKTVATSREKNGWEGHEWSFKGTGTVLFLE